MTTATAELVHIAGPAVQIGPLLRQRCAWCGAVLVDYDLTRVAVPVTWAVGELVAVADYASWYVPLELGAELPEGYCARLDPAVTR